MNIKILVAEDNQINQDVVMAILMKNGIEANTVSNGKEALAKLETNQYDLVLMDVQMPEMDGLQTTRVIRDSQSKVLDHAIPIIALTANALRENQDIYIQAGMNDYLTKPFKPAELMEKIVRWVKQANDFPVSSINNNQIFIETQLEEPLDDTMTPIIQFEDLCRRVMDDCDLALELLEKASKQLPHDLEELSVACHQKDYNLVNATAHRVKGSAGNLAAEPLRQAFEDLEIAAKATTPDDNLDYYLDSVTNASNAFINAVNDLLAENSKKSR